VAAGGRILLIRIDPEAAIVPAAVIDPESAHRMAVGDLVVIGQGAVISPVLATDPERVIAPVAVTDLAAVVPTMADDRMVIVLAATTDPVGIGPAAAGLGAATDQGDRIAPELVIDPEVEIVLAAATDPVEIGRALEIVPVSAGLAIVPVVIGRESPGPATGRLGTSIVQLSDRVGRMDVGTTVGGGVGTIDGTSGGTVVAGR
jgi:hypothetical protein